MSSAFVIGEKFPLSRNSLTSFRFCWPSNAIGRHYPLDSDCSIANSVMLLNFWQFRKHISWNVRFSELLSSLFRNNLAFMEGPSHAFSVRQTPLLASICRFELLFHGRKFGVLRRFMHQTSITLFANVFHSKVQCSVHCTFAVHIVLSWPPCTLLQNQ